MAEDLDRDEAHDLIASNRVEGTAVYGPDGEKIGRIHHFMVGKRDGRVRYAVMSFGGFLGMGEEYRPVPWDALDYSTKLGGYIASVDEEKLKGGPSYEAEHQPAWDRAYAQEIYRYWLFPF